MQGAHRPSSHHSLRNAHADIETPSWRRYAPPITDNTSLDHDLSDDDTTAEAYINRYHHLSLEERSRWAGPTSKNPSPSTPNSASRPHKKSSKGTTPFFPTPLEAFHLVRNAFNAYKQQDNTLPNANHINSHHSNTWEVLESLQPTLSYLAEHEEMLRSLKTRLKAAVNALAYHRDVNEARTHHWEKPSLQDFTLLYPFSLNSLVPCEPTAPISPNANQINGTLSHSAKRPISQPSTPPLPSNDSSLLTNHAITMINKYTVSKAHSFEETFRLETAVLRETLRCLAHQAQIRVPESASIQVICTEISRAVRSRRDSRSQQQRFLSQGKRDKSHKLEKFIRQEIDGEKYPLLAQTFQLDEDYCLDGTRMPIESVVQGKSNAPEPDQNHRKPWNSLHLLEPQTSDEHTRREQKPYSIDIMGSRERQGPASEPDENGRKQWNSLHLLEPQTSDEHTRSEGKLYTNDIIGSRGHQGPGLEPDQNDRKPWNSLNLLEPQTSDDNTRRERKPYTNDIIESRARQGPSDFVDRNGYGTEVGETKKTTSFENDNDLMLASSTFQASRLDARRKLRQNVKRKLPRIHKERRARKAFRFRDSAESISSGSSEASSPSPRWNSFREDASEAMGMARRPSVTVQFQQVVDLDDKEDGTEPSVVYLDDEG